MGKISAIIGIMKYVIIFSLVLAVLSLAKCYEFLALGKSLGLLASAYCNITFLHIFPRPFIIPDFIIHFSIWLAVGFGGYSLWSRYLRKRFP